MCKAVKPVPLRAAQKLVKIAGQYTMYRVPVIAKPVKVALPLYIMQRAKYKIVICKRQRLLRRRKVLQGLAKLYPAIDTQSAFVLLLCITHLPHRLRQQGFKIPKFAAIRVFVHGDLAVICKGNGIQAKLFGLCTYCINRILRIKRTVAVHMAVTYWNLFHFYSTSFASYYNIKPLFTQETAAFVP